MALLLRRDGARHHPDRIGLMNPITILEAFFSKPAVIGCVAVLALAAVGVLSIGYLIWSVI